MWPTYTKRLASRRPPGSRLLRCVAWKERLGASPSHRAYDGAPERRPRAAFVSAPWQPCTDSASPPTCSGGATRATAPVRHERAHHAAALLALRKIRARRATRQRPRAELPVRGEQRHCTSLRRVPDGWASVFNPQSSLPGGERAPDTAATDGSCAPCFAGRRSARRPDARLARSQLHLHEGRGDRMRLALRLCAKRAALRRNPPSAAHAARPRSHKQRYNRGELATGSPSPAGHGPHGASSLRHLVSAVALDGGAGRC